MDEPSKPSVNPVTHADSSDDTSGDIVERMLREMQSSTVDELLNSAAEAASQKSFEIAEALAALALSKSAQRWEAHQVLGYLHALKKDIARAVFHFMMAHQL